jgi:hypothetical protein
VAIVGWWLVLALMPETRSLFVLRGAPFIALGAFATGDLLIVALGSAIVSLKRGEGWTGSLAWLVSGAMIYGAAYTVTIALSRDAPALGALLMTPAALLTVAATVTISSECNAVSSGTSA